MLSASWNFRTIEKRFRSLNAENLKSAGQRAAKLLAVKIGGLKKKSAAQPRPHSNHPARFEFSRGWIILKFWCPVTLQPFDLQTPNFQHQKIYSRLKLCKNFKRLAAFIGWVLPCQSDLILHHKSENCLYWLSISVSITLQCLNCRKWKWCEFMMWYMKLSYFCTISW